MFLCYDAMAISGIVITNHAGLPFIPIHLPEQFVSTRFVLCVLKPVLGQAEPFAKRIVAMIYPHFMDRSIHREFSGFKKRNSVLAVELRRGKQFVIMFSFF